MVGQATIIVLNSISVGKSLSLTDMHGHGLRSNVMYFYFKYSLLSKGMMIWKDVQNVKWTIQNLTYFIDLSTKMDWPWSAKFVGEVIIIKSVKKNL